MDEIEKINKVKILEELHKNGRASLSEIAEKTGLSRQTVAKAINNLEKNKQIWGYSALFDPKLVGKKPFILMVKLDLSINTEDFFKKVTSDRMLKDHIEKFGVETSMFLHGPSEMMILLWAKDIIDAKKLINSYKKIYEGNIKEIDLHDVIATFRDKSIANPKILDEWKNLLL